MSDFLHDMLQLARNAAIVGGVVLFVLLCYWAVVSSQKFWTSSPPDWFCNIFSMDRRRKK